MRIGAVNYLNSKPLVEGLAELAPQAAVYYDLPSRLSDSLAAGRLDVALVPTVEWFRTPGYQIVSEACVACRGPVLSVKLHFRVPPQEVATVTLDEGSRTSSALTQILLAELYGLRPRCDKLPIGSGLDDTQADAVLLIGDRAMRPPQEQFCEVWDLGERWRAWTGLPFVFAMWIARADFAVADMDSLLSAARDLGVSRIPQIARDGASALGISEDLAVRYLSENLHFHLGASEQRGLKRFHELCVDNGLAPPLPRPFEHYFFQDDGCRLH